MSLDVRADSGGGGLLDFLETLVHIDPAHGRAVGRPVLALRFGSEGLAAPADARPVYRSTGLGVFRTGRGFYLRRGLSSLDVNVAAGEGTGFLAPDFWEAPLESRREFFLLALLMLLRREGLYGLHANGAARNGRGVLFIGDSGCGKTTWTLACLAAGWRYLSDDALLVRSTPDAAEVLAFRKGFSYDPKLAGRFPRLARAANGAPVAANRKRLGDLDSIFPGQFVASCIPTKIFFPRIGPEKTSHFVPIGQTEALKGIIRQSPGIMTQPEWAQPQLETLRQLAEQASAFELVSGADVLEDPAAAASLLEAA
jgi:hypothetical protein